MDLLAHYVRIHLTGAAAGIELFGRGQNLADPKAREITAKIRRELVEERRDLLGIAERLGSGDPVLYSTLAKIGERVERLKPNGHLVKRTPLTDVIDLEAMRDAVAGKIGGWEVLLQVSHLDRDLLQRLLDQGRRQHDELTTLHREAADRAFA